MLNFFFLHRREIWTLSLEHMWLVGVSILLASLIGFPLGILGFMLWLIMLFSAQIVFGGLLGRWILGPTEDKWGRVGRMALKHAARLAG